MPTLPLETERAAGTTSARACAAPSQMTSTPTSARSAIWRSNWGSQAVDLAPAQGAVIEMTPAEEGTYALVNHAFNFPGRGALGLFNAS